MHRVRPPACTNHSDVDLLFGRHVLLLVAPYSVRNEAALAPYAVANETMSLAPLMQPVGSASSATTLFIPTDNDAMHLPTVSRSERKHSSDCKEVAPSPDRCPVAAALTLISVGQYVRIQCRHR